MLLVFIVFLVLMFIGMPVAFALGISGTLFFLQHPELPFTIPIQVTVTQTQNFALLAIPMFTVAGNLMNEAGITERLLKLATVLTGHMRGGLAQVVVVLELLLGGVTGSCIADASMQARMLGLQMVKRGYSKGFTGAIIANASLITVMIPPGVGMILYGAVGNVSIGRLFAAGIIPGILMGLALMLAVSYYAKKRGYQPEREKRASVGETLKASLNSIWALLFPVMLLVFLRLGLFTASEVGSFAAAYAMVVGLLAYRELKWENFKMALEGSVIDTGGIMFLIALSAVPGFGVVWERLPEVISAFMLGITDSPTVFLVLVIAILLVGSMFVEGPVLILMLTPIFLPIAVKLGLDPVFFGTIFVLAVTIGNVYPPLGPAMFAVCSILDCTVEEFVRESLLFIGAMVLVNIILIWFPGVILWLPNLIFGK